MRPADARSLLVPCLLAFGLIAFGSTARAGMLLNGDFSDGPNGLEHWTVEGDGGVSVSGGQATIFESTIFFSTILYQNFTIGPGDASLVFVLQRVQTAPNDFSFFPPDAFEVSILDPVSEVSLVETVDFFTDAYYRRDLTPDVMQGEKASGVTVEAAGGDTVITVELKAPGGGSLAGQEAQIRFEVLGGGNNPGDASVTISNVTIGGSSEPPDMTVIPELGTLATGSLGVVICLGYAYCRRVRNA